MCGFDSRLSHLVSSLELSEMSDANDTDLGDKEARGRSEREQVSIPRKDDAVSRGAAGYKTGDRGTDGAISCGRRGTR